MRSIRLLLILALLGATAPLRAATPAPVIALHLTGIIGPATAEYVERGLTLAAREHAQLVVLTLDTPGGLDTSMRRIVQNILAAATPVVTYVAPSGARAASAGTFILYASHIAAMAPGTNVGAASPVAIMGGGSSDKDGKKGEDTMMHKAMNDAVAYIRGFAQLRHRNADWAEQAVRQAVSLPADEALKLKVIDYVAADVPALLALLDGKTVDKKKLELKDAAIQQVQSDWRTEFLAVITNPSVAYLLILVGVYGLLFEFMNPGLVMPGVVGVIALLIAAYALHLLPVNYAGLALMLLGIGFMVAEAFFPAYGSLGIGGLIAFVVGSIMLIEERNLPGFEIPYALIGGVAAASAGFLIFAFGMLMRSRRRPVVSGREHMIGASGEALEDFEGEGWARVRGESWRVRAAGAVQRGERLRVTS